MGKSVFIAEKPSVAREFAKALKYDMKSRDGYMESDEAIVTWCVGHLVTMSYPEAYDEKWKRWTMEPLPFLPKEFKYEVIEPVKKQFKIVSDILNRPDVDVIYVCTDSGREGEYIYRLVEMQANVTDKARKRVWIDSQTEEEILRGIREAKDLSAYDNLSSSAYLRAKEDYLMGINFSRVLTLKYGYNVKNFLGEDRVVISVGRVMTCVLGMVVNREREIRNFVKTPFYRVIANAEIGEKKIEAEWKAISGSKYFESPLLYKENGFKKKETAEELIGFLSEPKPMQLKVAKVERKKEVKNPPLLFNLAELQNECAKLFKISPDQTLQIVQELYEKKLTTYPRTDARVLSSAVAKEITKNIQGLSAIPSVAPYVKYILEKKTYEGLSKTKYVNDKLITDHYAIIPTGQGFSALQSLHPTSAKVYEVIVRRFLGIFCPPAVYQKVALTLVHEKEQFFSNFKVLSTAGYQELLNYSFSKKTEDKSSAKAEENEESGEDTTCDENFLNLLSSLKKDDIIPVNEYVIKEGETSPPKRYNSGSMILAMENAGQLIEDEDLRAQIKGSGIGTSATRAEILKKLVANKYLALNKKTQIITPTLLGESIYDVVDCSIKSLLDPKLTASWEKGLTQVAEGSITPEEYMEKLEGFILRRTEYVKNTNQQSVLTRKFQDASRFYKQPAKTKKNGG
ncbi:MAG: type IA DNA topoisomerase [Lachnospiraceae bacterium]|nr:type IA DNA topoisomerase [Lachnospiraceae bacterium]